jgi:hypothetical protein
MYLISHISPFRWLRDLDRNPRDGEECLGNYVDELAKFLESREKLPGGEV